MTGLVRQLQVAVGMMFETIGGPADRADNEG
jgi:hypothetical protein